MKLKIILFYILGFLITTLFVVWGYKIINIEVSHQNERNWSYLTSSATIVLQSIQDDISYIFNKIKDKSNNASWEYFNNDDEILRYLELDKYLLRDYSQVLNKGSIINLNSIDSTFTSYSFHDTENIEIYSDYLTNLDNIKYQDLIHIKNLKGYMIFPLQINQQRDLNKIAIYEISLEKIIFYEIPTLVKKVMLENNQESLLYSDFIIDINLGDEINPVNYDIVINLSHFFNLNSIGEYYEKRLKRNVNFFNSQIIVENNYYLTVKHKNGSLEKLSSDTFTRYFLVLVLTYFSIIITLSFLSYTVNKLHLNNVKEKEFTALISHELKTPLSVIELGAENISRGIIKNKEDINFYGEMIKKESTKLRKIIESILTFTSSTIFKVRKKENIKDLIDYIEEQSFDLSEQNASRVSFKNNSSVSQFYCNLETFKLAVLYVVENSIKYGASCAENKNVNFIISDYRKSNIEGIQFTVKDFGPGISNNEIKKVFEPFYRGKKVINSNISGTGLGLPLAKRIVEQHQGSIVLVKNIKNGCCFNIWIPVGKKYEKSNVN